MKIKKVKIIVGLIIAIPILMWVFWLLSPRKKLVIAIVDKTVLDKTGQEHISLNWVLNHRKYTKNNKEGYQIVLSVFTMIQYPV